MIKQHWESMQVQIDIEPFDSARWALHDKVASEILDSTEDRVLGHHMGSVADTIVPILRHTGQID